MVGLVELSLRKFNYPLMPLQNGWGEKLPVFTQIHDELRHCQTPKQWIVLKADEQRNNRTQPLPTDRVVVAAVAAVATVVVGVDDDSTNAAGTEHQHGDPQSHPVVGRGRCCC